jgi:hypothetical protein
MRTIRTMAAAAMALMVLGLAACGSDDDGSGSGTGGGDGGGNSADLCANARELESLGSGDALTDLDEATFTRLTNLVDGVRENAPDEIRADIDTVADGFADVREIFEEYDYDLAKLGAAAAADPELTERLESFGGADFTAASERVSTYLQEECGLSS